MSPALKKRLARMTRLAREILELDGEDKSLIAYKAEELASLVLGDMMSTAVRLSVRRVKS